MRRQPSVCCSNCTPTRHCIDANAAQNTRQLRSATALKQIASLQNRRQPGGLARGVFPSGQMVRRSPRAPSPQTTEDGADATPRFARNAAGPRTSRGSAPPPQGQMVRAPSTLRAAREAGDAAVKGPNLRARDARRPGAGGRRRATGNNRPGDGVKRRDRKAAGEDESLGTSISQVKLDETISDSMALHLLRLQRKEWDRVPYEPKYAEGSFAASELIHAGRELFKGESPPVKLWGPLEKRIGVVGMFGAEAHLKIRRVPDGDAEPFGHEVLEEAEPVEATGAEKNAAAVQ